MPAHFLGFSFRRNRMYSSANPLHHRHHCHLHHHHHHHHFQHHFLNHFHLLHNSFSSCPNHHHSRCQNYPSFLPLLSQNIGSTFSCTNVKNSAIEAASLCAEETESPQLSQMQEENLEPGWEEDDEPIFVLTDEWREFFAKSEARRKEEKKQRKKGKKM